MLSTSLPNSNSGACTPMTTNPSGAYTRFHALTYGAVRIQLTHVYSQKSTSTTFPRNASALSGGELTHRCARNDGKLLAAPATHDAATTPRHSDKTTLIMGSTNRNDSSKASTIPKDRRSWIVSCLDAGRRHSST